MKKHLWRLLLAAVIIIFAAINAVGLFAGFKIYQISKDVHDETVAERAGQVQEQLAAIRAHRDWQDVSLVSAGGYPLRGTFIPAPGGSARTVIFVHGFTASRGYGLSYVPMYQRLGYNVVLIDQRAHGESGGHAVSWGIHEQEDLDLWVQWVRERFPDGIIGVHGVSMGAATALLHAGAVRQGPQVAFYISDSAYASLDEIMHHQIAVRLRQDYQPLLEVLLRYADIAAYYDDRFTFHQVSPLRAVQQASVPILYIHGTADDLIPVSMAYELAAADRGPHQLCILDGAVHARGMMSHPAQYEQAVREFLAGFGGL